MEKNKLIIIEGPQGCGKTTLANYLRENIAVSDFFRLSGQKDKTATGKMKSKQRYETLLEYIEKMQNVPIHLIFDRIFFTEEVYARIGNKEYSFTDVYEDLVKRLTKTNYEIYLIILYLEDTDLYTQRLQRESHHNYQKFSKEGSIKQQNAYLEIATELENTSIHVIPLAMDDFTSSYNKINELFDIRK